MPLVPTASPRSQTLVMCVVAVEENVSNCPKEPKLERQSIGSTPGPHPRIQDVVLVAAKFTRYSGVQLAVRGLDGL